MKFKYYKNNLKILLPKTTLNYKNKGNKQIILYTLMLLKKKKQIKYFITGLKKEKNFKTYKHLIKQIKQPTIKEDPNSLPAQIKKLLARKYEANKKYEVKKTKNFKYILITTIKKNNVFTNLVENTEQKKTVFSNSKGIPSSELEDKEKNSKLFYTYLVQDVIKEARKKKKLKFFDCFTHKIITKTKKKNYKENFISTSAKYFQHQLISISKTTKIAHNGCKLSKKKRRRLKKKKVRFKLTQKYNQ